MRNYIQKLIFVSILILSVIGIGCTKTKKEDNTLLLLLLLLSSSSSSTTCSTTVAGATALTVGTSVTGTIKKSDKCFYTLSTTTADAYKVSVFTTTSTSFVDLGLTFAGSTANASSANLTGSATTSGITTNSDWAGFKTSSSSTSANAISIYNPASTTRTIAIYGNSCPSSGCAFSIIASATNVATTACSSIGNTSLGTDSVSSLTTVPYILVESGSTLSGLSQTTGNYCDFRLVSKTATTNSYTLSGMTSNLDLNIGSDGLSTSFTSSNSTNAGTTNETINNLSITQGSYRNVLVNSTSCAAGSCPFTLAVTSP